MNNSSIRLVGLNKKNADSILLKKGFRKQTKPFNYSRYIKNGTERIHIQLQKDGFRYHIDKH